MFLNSDKQCVSLSLMLKACQQSTVLSVKPVLHMATARYLLWTMASDDESEVPFT